MRKLSKLRVLLLIHFSTILSMSNFVFGQEEGWELAKTEKEISVYTRLAEGDKVKEFKSETIIVADVESVLKILTDVNSYPEWYSDSKSTKLLSKQDDNNLIFQMEMKVPFPFANRDMVSKMSVSKDNESTLVEIINDPDFMEENKGIVRMPIAEGSWKLTPLADGKLKINYRFRGDPGGSIPTWIVNMFIVDGPIKTLGNLDELLNN